MSEDNLISSIKKLYLLQLGNDGRIPLTLYLKLPENEKPLLEKDSTGTSYILKTKFRKKINVVLAGGVFDTLHAGHIFFLEKSKSFGDILIVSIAEDKHVIKKGRSISHSQIYRTYLVNSIKYVDKAILGRDNPEDILNLVKPDVLVYGYDQKPFLKPKGIRIIKLTDKLNPDIFKSSKLLKKIDFEEI